MADGAFERFKRHMEASTEMQLAELIMKDVRQLEENAKEMGVTAYLRKPVHRVAPNERFLRNTMRSINFANQKADENAMWRVRDMQVGSSRSQTTRKRSHSAPSTSNQHETYERTAKNQTNPHREYSRDNRSKRRRTEYRAKSPASDWSGDVESGVDFGGGMALNGDCESLGWSKSVRGSKSVREETDEGHQGWDDQRVEDFLASRDVRGRGGVGSRMSETDMVVQEDVSKKSESPLKVRKKKSKKEKKRKRHKEKEHKRDKKKQKKQKKDRKEKG